MNPTPYYWDRWLLFGVLSLVLLLVGGVRLIQARQIRDTKARQKEKRAALMMVAFGVFVSVLPCNFLLAWVFSRR